MNVFFKREAIPAVAVQRGVGHQPPATPKLPPGLPTRIRKVSQKELQRTLPEYCRHQKEQLEASGLMSNDPDQRPGESPKTL